jgi:FAD dependent oxidoreductase TIGR03364
VERFDVAVVGAGIVGLAHALAAASRGLRVMVLERSPRAVGASVRNFGMVWPIGQPAGPLLERARRTREIWLRCAAEAGFAAEQCGALHAATSPYELAVLEEFTADHGTGHHARMLSPAEACRTCRGLRPDSLLGAMRSELELCVDPREAIRAMPGYLERRFGAHICLGACVKHVQPGLVVLAGGSTLGAERVIVCSGAETDLLFPAVLRDAGVRPCKLQMLRTVPQPIGWRVGPHLAFGLTLLHYAAFAACPSLPALRARAQEQFAEHLREGVHVMVSQSAGGQLTIGDSHAHGDAIEPFDRDRIERLILGYLGERFQPPDPCIAERWHGVYARLNNGRTELVARVAPGVFVVNGLGGMGMTLSFGLAEETIDAITADRAWEPPSTNGR